MILTSANNRCIFKNLVSCTRKFSQRVCYESTISSRYPDYYLVYQFPYIRAASMINRLKYFQTGVTGLGIPISLGFSQFDLITTDEVKLYFSAGIIGCILLYTAGFLGHNRIGFVYLKNDNTNVKIAYTNFWGRRVDIDVAIDDIVPLSEAPVTISNALYYTFRRYSTKQTLKLTTKYGGIVDAERFCHIFGPLS